MGVSARRIGSLTTDAKSKNASVTYRALRHMYERNSMRRVDSFADVGLNRLSSIIESSDSSINPALPPRSSYMARPLLR